ncbi:uncharacterized protein [Montipora foliosa]|uniref:uncharacterized protein n=1 Tax=Montipora foliosa TaxID=591990 RepID=UPI0035F11EB0
MESVENPDDRQDLNVENPDDRQDLNEEDNNERSNNSEGRNGEGIPPKKPKQPHPYTRCWNCGGWGHVKSQCPSKEMKTREKRGRGATAGRSRGAGASRNMFGIGEQNSLVSI